MKKLFALYTFILILFSCALEPITGPRRPDPANEPTPVPTSAAIAKPIYFVERGDVEQRLEVSGRIVPRSEMELRFGIDGVVKTVLVDSGQMVAAGEPIAQLDPGPVEERQAQAAENLRVAQTALTQAEGRFATDQRLAEIDLERAQLALEAANEMLTDPPSNDQLRQIRLRELDVEEAELALNNLVAVDPQLVAQVIAAEQELSAINKQLEETTLLAPMAGEILSLSIVEGSEVGRNQLVGLVADTSVFEIQTTLDEEEMVLLSEGMAAEISFNNRPIPPIDATVRLLPAPYGNGEATQLDGARLSFGDPAVTEFLSLRLLVSVSIVTLKQEDVLWLPPGAIREFSGRRFVVIEDESGQQRVDISRGIFNPDQVEITQGVEEGDKVIGP